MQREDTKPWYRQFWPWFIIALPASAVVGGLTTVWIAMQTTDSLVLKSEDGIRNASDRKIAAERLASELGLAAALSIDPGTGVVTVVMRSGDLDTAPQTLDLELSHPTLAGRDQAITLTKALPVGVWTLSSNRAKNQRVFFCSSSCSKRLRGRSAGFKATRTS